LSFEWSQQQQAGSAGSSHAQDERTKNEEKQSGANIPVYLLIHQN
jgi:hypothetical protein